MSQCAVTVTSQHIIHATHDHISDEYENLTKIKSIHAVTQLQKQDFRI